jgi:hypothetical protein
VLFSLSNYFNWHKRNSFLPLSLSHEPEWTLSTSQGMNGGWTENTSSIA